MHVPSSLPPQNTPPRTFDNQSAVPTPATTPVPDRLVHHDLYPVPPAPTKRRMETAKIVAVRLDSITIYQLLLENTHLLNDPLWNKVTHVLFTGFDLVDNHVVFAEFIELLHPRHYSTWLHALKKNFPHLSIYWSLPPIVNQNQSLYTVLKNNNGCHATFWATANFLLKKVDADGFELCLESCRHFDFHLNLVSNFWQKKTIVSLPSTVTPQDLEKIVPYTQYILFNTFGFFQYAQIPCQPSLIRVLTSHESAAQHTQNLIEQLPPTYHPKILLGFDTCGILYRCIPPSTNQVATFTPVSHRLIQHWLHEKKWVWQHDLLYHQSSVISLDHPDNQDKKLQLVLDKQLAGVVIGKLINDLAPLANPKGLLHICYNKLAENHHQDYLISPQPSKRVRTQPVETNVQV